MVNWTKEKNKELVAAILTLKRESEIRSFLRDLMTEKEIEEFANRFKAAQMLSRGIPYSEIGRQTWLSSTTIARVSKWLNGTGGGYRTAIARIHHHNPILSRRGLS